MPIKVRINGAWHDAVVAAGGTAPGVPQSVNAVSTVSGQIDVSWAAPASAGSSPITGYVITVTDLSTNASRTANAAASARAASFGGLIVADTYSVVVQAANASGPSPTSAKVNVTVAGTAGTGSGAGVNSSGSNVGEFGSGDLACYRGPTNTGPYAVFDTGLGRLVQSSDLTDYSGNNLSGDITFSTPNTTYFRKKIRADRITYAADGLQFIQCDIKANDGSRSKSGSYFNTISGSGRVVKFIDCVLDGNGVSGGLTGTYPSGYGFESMFSSTGSPYILRCEMKGAVDIMKSMHNGYIGYSWLHGNVTYFATSSGSSKTHSDHVQIAASSENDSTWEYCTFGTPKSVAKAAGTDWTQFEYNGNASGDNFVNGGICQFGSGFNSTQTIKNLVMRYNYCNDGGYVFNGDVTKAGSATGTIQGNRCGPYMQWGTMPSSMRSAALDGTALTFTGDNVIDDDFIAYWNNGAHTKGTVWA